MSDKLLTWHFFINHSKNVNMKLASTLFVVLFLKSLSFSQITILASDIPVPPEIVNFDDISTSKPGQPSTGANQNWDYSAHFGNNPFSIYYPVETIPFYTNAGIDVYLASFKNLNSNLGYNIYNELDWNGTDVLDSGLDIPFQSYSLGAYTGNPSDSLVFPAQQYILSTPRILMHFPMTANSSWHSNSQRVTNFTLTVGALGLNKIPGQQKYTLVRNDSIVGWGKLSVYTPNGPSIRYDVLMDRIEQYAVDSFFIAGGPAPTVLLTSFGITQGQISGLQYAYNFYRKGSYAYLMRMFYGTDKTYSTISQAFVSTDDVLTGVNNTGANTYSSLIFPNPSNGHEINVQLNGKVVKSATYSLYDLTGRTVQHGTPAMQGNGFMQIKLQSTLSNGNYLLRLFDESQHEIISEKITVQL
jgi:hypothetical protein